MKSGETIEQARARGKVYGVLALAFYPPTTNAERIWYDLMRLLRALPADGSTHGQDAATFPSVDFQKLEHEYNRLFVGPGHVVCPPYESVYATDGRGSECGLVLGPSSLEVQVSYREGGLRLAEGFTDLPDHVAVELEFMKYLCDRESDTSRKSGFQWRSRQAKFIGEHLSQWIPAFADSVTRNTTSPYYRTAAELLKEFVKEEAENLPSEAGE